MSGLPGKYNEAQYRRKVEDYTKICARLFNRVDLECFEEILCCGIAIFVVRVSVVLIPLIHASIDASSTSMAVINLLTTQ